MLMTFYCTLLPDKVPSGRYQTPSLPFFAHYWQDGLTDIQQSARSLFGSAVAGLFGRAIGDRAARAVTILCMILAAICGVSAFAFLVIGIGYF